MNIINQYSYILLGIGALALCYALMRRYWRVRWLVVLGVQLLLIVFFLSGFILLRPGLMPVDSTQAALNTILNGRPTFVEFFSNYCSACLTMNPIVEEIILELGPEYDVLQVDIHSTMGRELRQELGFSFTPEFVIFDRNGQEMWRDHIPPSEAVLEEALSFGQTLRLP